VKFPTGGESYIALSPRPMRLLAEWLIWWESRTDSKVWMGEG